MLEKFGETALSLLRWLATVCFFLLVIGSCAYLVKKYEKPWPIDRQDLEHRPLEQQVSLCSLVNLNTGLENISEIMRIAGMRPDMGAAIDLVVSGKPKFGRRYNCFANLTVREAELVKSADEYILVQQHIQRGVLKFNRISGGF